MAVNLGITNLNMLADMALFKRMLKIPTRITNWVSPRNPCAQGVDGGLRPKRGFLQGDRQLGERKKLQRKPENDIKDVFLHVPKVSAMTCSTCLANLMQWKFRFSMLVKKLLYKYDERRRFTIS